MSKKSSDEMSSSAQIPELKRKLRRTSRGMNPKQIRTKKSDKPWIESYEELKCALVLEYRKDVIRYKANPLTFTRRFQCPDTLKIKEQDYTPDFLVEFADGRSELWEVKATEYHAKKAQPLLDDFRDEALKIVSALIAVKVSDLVTDTMLQNLQGLSTYLC